MFDFSVFRCTLFAGANEAGGLRDDKKHLREKVLIILHNVTRHFGLHNERCRCNNETVFIICRLDSHQCCCYSCCCC